MRRDGDRIEVGEDGDSTKNNLSDNSYYLKEGKCLDLPLCRLLKLAGPKECANHGTEDDKDQEDCDEAISKFNPGMERALSLVGDGLVGGARALGPSRTTKARAGKSNRASRHNDRALQDNQKRQDRLLDGFIG